VSFFGATESGMDVAGSRKPPKGRYCEQPPLQAMETMPGVGPWITGAPESFTMEPPPRVARGWVNTARCKLLCAARCEPGLSGLATTPVTVSCFTPAAGVSPGETTPPCAPKTHLPV
jgi:hypothetical protein